MDGKDKMLLAMDALVQLLNDAKRRKGVLEQSPDTNIPSTIKSIDKLINEIEMQIISLKSLQ